MADPIMMPITNTKFQLDKTIVAPEGSLTIDIGASTDHDVITAILENKPFPNRPNGKIELGSIELKADTGRNFAFAAGETTIGFQASADFKSGLGVFDSAADAISALQLTDASEINLNIAGDGSERFLVLLSGYDLQGSFSGSHPIGVVGSLGFGATGDHDLRYAVVHRFASTSDARTAVDLERTVENVLHNGTNEFGDIALSMQVALPSSVLASWFIRRDGDRLKQDSLAISRALQKKLRQLLPLSYLQDINRLRSNPSVAALLVWAALPVSTSIDLHDGTATLNSDNDVFWDFSDSNLRHAMAMSPSTETNLIPALQNAQTRLREVGDDHDASFFIPQQAATFQRMTLDGMGDTLLNSLLFTEAEIIRGATAALKDVNEMLDAVATTPTKAIGRFADFGADLTDAFNNKLSSVYGNDALRTLSSMVLVEATRAIDRGLGSQAPKAMLNIITLQNDHQFQLGDFVAGVMPQRDQVAIAQTLVNLSS